MHCSEDDFPTNHSLCHGLIGDYAVFNLYVNHFNDIILADRMRCLHKRILTGFKNNQIYFGDREIIEDYSFMLGLSGIGYELLRWKNPEISSVLEIEL